MTRPNARRHVVALCGGVGGSKVAAGLAAQLAPEDLTIVVNTGDDFEHLGLSISPDIDTVIYTLAGLADKVRGWGLADETWAFMNSLKRLGGEDWFNLGDRDLATHVERTRRLQAGETLSQVTAAFADRLSIGCVVTPMSDDPVRTMVETESGPLAFQHYFVRDKCMPVARGILFDGAAEARLSPAAMAALSRNDLRALIICPSNPYLSVDPILAVAGVCETLVSLKAPRMAICPIIGGEAVKGPTAKLMRELGVEPGPASIARHYAGLIDGLLIDRRDASAAADVEALGVRCSVEDTLMHSEADRVRVAFAALESADRLAPSMRQAGA